MLDGDDDGAPVANFGFGGQGEENASGERENRCNRGLRRRFVFVMTERTGVEDSVCALVVGDCLVAKVDGGFRSASSEFFGILIDVVKVVLFW